MARTSPHIGNTPLEMMNLILEFVKNFEVDRLLYAINGKHLDEQDIIGIKIDIAEYNAKLERGKTHLYKFGETFNKRFTTENNKCFDTAVKVTRKIRSGTACVKKIFMRFCKPTRKPLPNSQAYKRSMINTPNYIADLFGLESYPQCVVDLFSVMLVFYGNLDDCIAECMRQMSQEKETRKNRKLLVKLLDEAIEKSQQQQAHIILAMDKNPKLREELMKDDSLSSDKLNPVLKDYRECRKKGCMEVFAQKYFHNCLTMDVDKIALDISKIDYEEDPEMAMAMAVLGNDKEHIARINYAIDHFDQLLPAQCKRGKIPAMSLFFFMQWCKPVTGVNSFLTYFNKRYKAANGRWGTLGNSAINGAHSKCTLDKEDTIAVQRAEFMKEIEDLVSIFNKEK